MAYGHHSYAALAAIVQHLGHEPLGGVLIKAQRALCDKGEQKIQKPSWAAGHLMGMIEHPVFFVPLVTGDEVTAARAAREIAEEAVETFLARYGV